MGAWSLIIPLPGGDEETIELAGLSVKVRDETGTDLPQLLLNAPANVYQSFDVRPRLLILNLSPRTRHAAWPSLRAQLSALLAPDRVPAPLPVTLRYTGSARVLDLSAVFAPRPGDLDREADFLDLRFVAFDPYWRTSTASSQALGVRTSVANANNVLERSSSGIWTALGSGLAAQVNALIYSSAGTLYAGGQFAGYVRAWNGVSWSTLGALNGEVNALVFGPDGTLYAGGAFTGNVARWTSSAWSTVGAVGAICQDLIFGRNGVLYAVAGANVRAWNGAAWSTVGAIGGTPDCLAVGLDGTLFCGGNATTGVKKLVGSAWVSIGAIDDSVLDLVVGLDGTLYAIGVFTTIGGVAAARAAQYNGVAWFPVATGLDDEGDALLTLADGRIVFAGGFLSAGGLPLVDSLAYFNGYAFAGADVDLPGAAQILALAAFSGRLALGGSFTGTALAAAITTATNAGSSAAPLRLIVSLPAAAAASCRIYALQNFTSGDAIDFNYSLLPGETLTLDLTTEPKSCSSSFFGDVMSGIVPGSKVASFRLLPGGNSISLLLADATATAALEWYEHYWTIDGADS